MIIGIFSDKGPVTCSGLPVRQYSLAKLEQTFTPYFETHRSFNPDHITPLLKSINLMKKLKMEDRKFITKLPKVEKVSEKDFEKVKNDDPKIIDIRNCKV
jgi:hypothetical protein